MAGASRLLANQPDAGDSSSAEHQLERIEQISPPVADSIRAQPAEVQTEIFSVARSGPLPAASELAGYDAVLPGLAERIVAMAEREQQHRHIVDAKSLDHDFRLKTTGQYMGAGALVLMLGVIAYMVGHGFAGEASALGTAMVAAVVAIFVIGRRLEASDLNE
jgi:uncharacterized membrane protein